MKIALITGSRADRGALEMVDAALKIDHKIAGFNAEPVNGAASPNEAVEVAERASWSVRHRLLDWPADFVIVHGDRHEILGAAMAANIMGVPVAHIGGGDLTEGSQDDCFRHAITKLSHLHFATCEESAARIIQMGEQPDRVHVTGDPGIDRVMATQLLDRNATFDAVGLKSCERALLVSLHPNTIANQQDELTALSEALKSLAMDTYFDPSIVLPVDEYLAKERFGKKNAIGLVFIGPNADSGSDQIRKQWNFIVAEMPQQAVYHKNLAGQVYLSLMRWCDVMVGNSSAGFYEAPCFGTKVINIGDRQKGRRRASNIADCSPVASDIKYKIKTALGSSPWNVNPVVNPYGNGHAAERIAKIIDAIKDPRSLLRKRFHNVGAD